MIPGVVVGWSIRVRLLRWAGLDLGEPLHCFKDHRSLGVVVEVRVDVPEIRDAVRLLDGALRAFAVEKWTLDDVDLGDPAAGREATFEHRECAREIVMPGCPGGEA